jgi:hypothetical protein
MAGNPMPDLTPESVEDATATTPVVPAPPVSASAARIDLAQVADSQFLVYGWVLGFTKLINSASINLGGVVIDLVKQAIPVRRPDVAMHFSLETGNDAHGFYALVDLPDKIALVEHLTLVVNHFSGETAESLWPVSWGNDGRAASVIEPHAETLRKLLPHLPRPEARRLVEFARSGLGLQAEAEFLLPLPPPIRVVIDLCCVLDSRLLVVWGWIVDPVDELTQARLRIGASVFQFLENSVRITRPDINSDPLLHRRGDASPPPGFMFVHSIPRQDAEAGEARFDIAAGAEAVRFYWPVSRIPQETRRDFLSLLSKVDPDSALRLCEYMAAVLDELPEKGSLGALLELVRNSSAERLSPTIQHVDPRYSLYLDRAIRVAGEGVFLIGWFNAEATASVQVICHCGSSSFIVSDNWIRQPRADVSSHLAKEGITVGDHDHGFSCYVPLHHGQAPYYLSAVPESGEARRMRVTLAEKQESAAQTVRALLSSFNWSNRELRFLMEHHIGPAVGAVWAARQKPSRTPAVRSYGTKPANPTVSVIVPLYGRHDFAEYQMALFADDSEFQGAELIYVVDDPTIISEFYCRCADLYGIYQVPFVVAYPGSNLGFAGANNFGAEVARGQHLLLMNSDVLPKRAGWLGDLLRIHGSLSTPGLLGAKLLFEDGSVQHAGMIFRRLAAWDNLWTNHHPSKGQTPAGLSGVRQVAAVTAACALIEAALYRELGGFSEDYIIGDFEDSDLCLRASLAGRRNYVALDVELYHLERQSQNRVGDAEWRTNITLYNCWLHNSRWADLIEKMNLGNA